MVSKENAVKTIKQILAWRIAIIMFALFSLNSLCTAIIAALTGTVWNELDGQAKFLIILAIFVNWSGTIMAFLSKAAQKMHIPVLGDDTVIINGKPQQQ